eukprot:scaffold5892_cov14-Tisochrysis_lutea.AAC.1
MLLHSARAAFFPFLVSSIASIQSGHFLLPSGSALFLSSCLQPPWPSHSLFTTSFRLQPSRPASSWDWAVKMTPERAMTGTRWLAAWLSANYIGVGKSEADALP